MVVRMTRILTVSIAAVALAASWAFAGEPVSEPTVVAPAVDVLDAPHFLAAADAAARQGDRDAAIQLFQSAIVYAPNDPVPYAKLGNFYAGSGQAELASQYYNSALNVQPAYAPALQGLALLALASGNRAGAEAQHNILLRACGPNCPETTEVGKALSESAAGNRP
jgi:Flp pilus assembly protein TadD